MAQRSVFTTFKRSSDQLLSIARSCAAKVQSLNVMVVVLKPRANWVAKPGQSMQILESSERRLATKARGAVG